MSKLTYIRCGDYDIPNLKLSEQPETSIGKYGRMRKSYLKEHRPILYNHLLMSEKLYPHLLEIDRAARERMEAMLPRMMEAAGITEELKARAPPALGGADEHAEGASGGNCFVRNNLQLIWKIGKSKMAVFVKNEETISSAIHFSNKKTPVHPKRLYRSLWIKMVIVK